ncbi:MAG: hypothetical protein R3183_02620 [Oleiphilaceae bacterium]|nr:hypothetical protein [Oleiphilaceae bacterium]
MSKVHNQRTQLILMFFAFSFGMILSNLLGQGQLMKGKQATGEEILLTYRGIDKTIHDLPEEIAAAYSEVSEKLQREQVYLLHNAALQWQLNDYAAQHDLAMDEAAHRYFDWQTPDEQAISRFYHEQADRLAKPFYQVKQEINDYLSLQRAKQARQQRLAELIERGDLIVFPDRP